MDRDYIVKQIESIKQQHLHAERQVVMLVGALQAFEYMLKECDDAAARVAAAEQRSGAEVI